MRRFTLSAADYLRIVLGEIIEYAAITITPLTAGTPSMADLSPLKRLGFRQPHGAIPLAKGPGLSLTRFDALMNLKFGRAMSETTEAGFLPHIKPKLSKDLGDFIKRGLLGVADLHAAEAEEAAFSARVRDNIGDMRKPALEGFSFARRLFVNDGRGLF
jgi:hypothetical protein